ncbi:hypothetical protein KSP39_PZI017733 [Platanthera zijinensis]|uniref:Uncharacterized protein n=1 Tax=Platanthera zijinensis TaxID=2320716 RepID=A0AAP0B731_9ASPA
MNLEDIWYLLDQQIEALGVGMLTKVPIFAHLMVMQVGSHLEFSLVMVCSNAYVTAPVAEANLHWGQVYRYRSVDTGTSA